MTGGAVVALAVLLIVVRPWTLADLEDVDREPRQERLGERADRQRVGDGADADRAAEQPADREHRHLDAGADQPDRPAGARGQPGHQPVARAGPEPGADVGRGRDAVEHDAADQQRAARGQAGRLRDQGERGVDADRDDDHVRDRPDPRTLAQRDPQQEDRDAGDGRDQPEAQRQVACQALVEDVPGIEAQRRAQLHRHARAVEHQATQQLRDAARWGGGDGQGTQVDGGHEVHRRRSGLEDQGQFDAQWPGPALGRRGRWCVRFRRSAVRGAGAGSGGGHAQGGRSRGAGVRAAGVRRRDGLGRGPAPDQRRHHRPGGSTGVRHVEGAGGAGPAQQRDRHAPLRRLRQELLRARGPGLGGPVRPGVAARAARRAAGRRGRRPRLRHLARRRRSRCPTRSSRPSRPRTSARA